jgi:precorrin-8X/cobalt-precorrin-8 methylmutase
MALHPITAQSFAIIDQEVGEHSWNAQEYAIVRRAIHSTADFELRDLFVFHPGAIAAGISALKRATPVLVDVRMVQMGITSTLTQIPNLTSYCALDYEGEGVTRTAAGLSTLAQTYPQGIFVIGNAPTALLALVELIRAGVVQPALVVGVPVGFVAVEEAKAALAEVDVPQIQVRGRKGGSPIAAAIVNALVQLAVESTAGE